MVKIRSLSHLGLVRHRVVTDGQTDGRADRIAIANTRYSSTCRYGCVALKAKVERLRVYISHIWGEEPPLRIDPIFLAVGARDVIT